MTLPAPLLDNRSYQGLRDELVRRIPVYAPEWTDHNPTDPGIALIELFAYLGENVLFRFNQIPEATQLAFLRLLDVPLRPAVPARALLTLTAEAPAGVYVPEQTEAKAGKLAFETRGEVHAWPVDIRAVARIEADPPDDEESLGHAERAIDALGLQPDEHAAFYVTQTVPADPMAPDATSVDLGASVDGLLWLALLPQQRTEHDLLAGATLSIGFVPDQDVTGIEDVEACPGAGTSPSPPDVRWEVSTGELREGVPQYRPLTVESDTSAGLTRPGVVQLRLPHDPRLFADFVPDVPDLRGAGAFPPDLEDDDAHPLCWLRAYRPDGSSLGRVAWVGVNAVPVEQALRALPEFLGTGTGDAGQRYPLVHAPVIAGSLQLQVEQDGHWTDWTEVDGFHASGEDDRHFVLDAAAAVVRFGGGRGRAPQIGERIRAVTYRYGGGQAGNVAAGAIGKLAGPAGVKATNPLPAWGGSDGEPVRAALERIPGELRRRDRAVTADDFGELALLAAQGQVARAEVLPLFHPRRRDIEAAGVVSVIVWPSEDRKRPDAPMPDRALLRTVCASLDERRLVTTELYVLPPTYRDVAVSVGIEVRDGYPVEGVRRWVDQVLHQYLAPLPPYGPEGHGWPLGRRVYGPELEAAALQVEGVEYLHGLRVAERGDSGAWVEGTVELDRWEVPHLAALDVSEGEAAEPGSDGAPPTPDATPVPIPTLRDEC